MSRNEPVDPRVRLAITQWPPDAPRGAVSTFCLEHGISRKTFYEIRKRVQAEGPAAALEPRSRRPRTSPTTIADDVKAQAIGVRAALERSGLDHGPISVHEKMRSLGMIAPSPASLARIFRDAGVAKLEPRKKPRAAFRRFVYPAPNACWQLDATEYVLAGGRKCVIFQLIDDHSRYAVASLVADAETSDAAIAVVDKGIAAHGVPQRLLTDNGSALNPSRRGYDGQLVAHVKAIGVQPITGKPYRPTTQGKNERFHQTLFRFLDKQPIADALAELQEQVDRFDAIYNTERPHQALPGRITPRPAWDATPKADPPKPGPPPPRTPIAFRTDGRDDQVRGVKVAGNGTAYARGDLLPDQPRPRRPARVTDVLRHHKVPGELLDPHLFTIYAYCEKIRVAIGVRDRHPRHDGRVEVQEALLPYNGRVRAQGGTGEAPGWTPPVWLPERHGDHPRG